MSSDVQFAPCGIDAVREFVVLNHYSRSCPKGGIVSHCFAAKVEDMLVGAAVFGHKAGNARTGSIFVPPYDTPEACRELIRLVMSDVLPKYSEGHFIGQCLRYLQGHSEIKGLLSYADPEQKHTDEFGVEHRHTGTVYRATNWQYTGLSHPSKKFIVDGKEMHQRSVSNLFGTCSVPAIQAAGHTVEVRLSKPKHRYIYVLQKSMLPFVKYPIVKFVAVLLLSVGLAMGSVGSCAIRVTRAVARWFNAKLLKRERAA